LRILNFDTASHADSMLRHSQNPTSTNLYLLLQQAA